MLFKEDKVARADAEAIRKGIGFYRWTHDLVEVTGRDALEVLQKIYISDLSKVPVGKSKYTASLDENGEIIDDVIVMHMAEGLYWVSDLYGPRLLPWIDRQPEGHECPAGRAGGRAETFRHLPAEAGRHSRVYPSFRLHRRERLRNLRRF